MSTNIPIPFESKPSKYGCVTWVDSHEVHPKDGNPYHRRGHARHHNCSDKQQQSVLQDMVKEFQNTSCR